MCIRNFRPVDGTGIQLQLARLLPLLEARGVQSRIVSGRSVGFARRDNFAGAPVRRSLVPGPGVSGTASYAATFAANLRRDRQEIDVVHVHGGRDAAPLTAAAARAQIPIVIKVSRAGTHNDLKVLAQRPFGKRLVRYMVANAWFIAQSSAVHHELRELGAPEERIFPVPNGVDTTMFHPAASQQERADTRRRFGLPDGPLAMWTGRLESMKRIDLLLRAIADGTGVALALVGSGREQGRLEKLARGSGVADRVFFVPPTRDVADLLRSADMFVHPSDSEGLANALLEAMATGLPCIVSRVLDVPELGGAERAVIGAPDGVQGWADSIRMVAGDPTLRKRYADRALQVVREDFTIERTADRLVRVYDTMSKEKMRR